MLKSLSPGAIGVRGLPLPDAIDRAKRSGFGGIHIDMRAAAALS